MAGLAPAPRRRSVAIAFESSALPLADGSRTTVHVARFRRRQTRLRVVSLSPPRTLASWCDESGVADAMIGGFFMRGAGTPLGEVRIDGRPLPHEPFERPWRGLRACLHVDGLEVALAPRNELRDGPLPGDLIEAGPLLVRGGREVIAEGSDPEGFSSGAAQFDSDITAGRYPRSALGLNGEEQIAVVCDGRGSGDAGLTLAELAATMRELGAEEAINLDGGGSASLVVDGSLRNRPREEHGLDLAGGRPVATAIAFEPA